MYIKDSKIIIYIIIIHIEDCDSSPYRHDNMSLNPDNATAICGRLQRLGGRDAGTLPPLSITAT